LWRKKTKRRIRIAGGRRHHIPHGRRAPGVVVRGFVRLVWRVMSVRRMVLGIGLVKVVIGLVLVQLWGRRNERRKGRIGWYGG